MIRTSTILGAAAALLLIVSAGPAPAATQPTTETGRPLRAEIKPYPESGYIRDLIERAQRALTTLGLYDGPVNGVVDPLLIEAIKQFQQRRGGGGSTRIDEELVARLESSVDIEALLDRLADIRERNTETARAQLLSNPATRKLLEDAPRDETAEIGRDSSGCFRDPTPKCLLDEATESAKAVATDGRRDWAFGEILVAQILAGLQDEALSTTRRITDPRLIIVALRRIAEAEAEAGRAGAALDALSLIPDAAEQSLARTAVARSLSDQGNHAAALSAAEPLLSGVRQAEQTRSRTVDFAHRSSLAAVLANGERRDDADRLLVELVMEARNIDAPDERGVAYRRIAMAYLAIGEPDIALAMLDQMVSDSDRNTILIAAASQLAARQRIDQAFELADRVAGERYRALTLIDIAERLAATDEAAARTALIRAEEISAGIELPFAREYALSRLALAHALVDNGDAASDRIAATISDPVLRAETYWRLHLEYGLPVLDKAEAASDNVQGAFNLAWLFADLADRMTGVARPSEGPTGGAALFERAIGLAAEVKTPWARSRLLARLAETLGRLR